MTEKKPYYIALDLETIGLPEFASQGSNKYYAPTDTDKYNNARVVQMGYIIYTKDAKVINGRKFIIKPSDFAIVPSAFHNITEEIAKNKGVSFEYFVKKFNEDIKDVKEIIGHNIIFDVNILASELYRNNNNKTAELLLKLKQNCTMEMSKNICGLTIDTMYGQRIKSPSLVEAYKIIVGKELKNHHDAYSDALHSSHIFFMIINNA